MGKRRGILLSQGKCHLNLKMDDLGGAESSISPPKWQICLPEREPVVHLAGKVAFSRKKRKRAPRHLSGRGARLLGLWVDQLRTVPLMPWAWRSRLSPPQNCSRGWSIKTSSGRISWSKPHNLNQMILPITMKSPLSIVFLLGSSS